MCREQLAQLSVHADIASKLNRLIDEKVLVEMGKLEQDLVYGNATSKEVVTFLNYNRTMGTEEKVRLVAFPFSKCWVDHDQNCYWHPDFRQPLHSLENPSMSPSPPRQGFLAFCGRGSCPESLKCRSLSKQIGEHLSFSSENLQEPSNFPPNLPRPFLEARLLFIADEIAHVLCGDPP